MTKYAARAQILNFQNTFDSSCKDKNVLHVGWRYRQKISSERDYLLKAL